MRLTPNITTMVPSAIAGCSSFVSLEVPDGLKSFRYFDESSFGIQSCQSLINLYLPRNAYVDFDSFVPNFVPSNIQLAEISTTWAGIVQKIEGRFDNRPLHKMCYLQSYHPILETNLKIQDILTSNPTAHEQVDTFGMTPLHILMLAENPVMELLRELPTCSTVESMIRTKDSFGSTPLDYRCKNAAGREAIQTWLRQVLQERLPFLGLDRWKKELLDEERGILISNDAAAMSRQVGSVLNKLVQVEFQEVISMVEIFLWRIQLEENYDAGKEHCTTFRQSCRVHCGISIVVENVLPFLGKQIPVPAS